MKLKNGEQYIITLCVRYEGEDEETTEEELLAACAARIDQVYETAAVSIERCDEPAMEQS